MLRSLIIDFYYLQQNVSKKINTLKGYIIQKPFLGQVRIEIDVIIKYKNKMKKKISSKVKRKSDFVVPH